MGVPVPPLILGAPLWHPEQGAAYHPDILGAPGQECPPCWVGEFPGGVSNWALRAWLSVNQDKSGLVKRGRALVLPAPSLTQK